VKRLNMAPVFIGLVLAAGLACRAESAAKADWVNVGSSTGLFSFDWSSAGVRGLNLAAWPQGTRRDFEKLKLNRALIADGAKVIIPLCPFTSVLQADYDRRYDAATNSPLLAFDGVPDASALEGFRDSLDKGWRREFKIGDYADAMTAANRRSYREMVAVMRGLLAWCRSEGLRPVLVYPPAAKVFDGLFPDSFRTAYILDYVRDVSEGKVMFLDYWKSPEFRDDALFANALMLNATGRKKFTAAVIARVDEAKALGETYWRTRSEADRLAWVQALAREGHDFKRHARTATDDRGVYKFNRESRLACIRLWKGLAPGRQQCSWDEDTADGKVHFEWSRKANGGFSYTYSAPTNWDVFVSAYPGRVTRYAAKIVKGRYRKGDPFPNLDLPQGWRLVSGEEYTGVNVREAFLTVEAEGTNCPAPRLSVNWPDVGVASVHGARDVVMQGDRATFVPAARQAPMGFSTSLSSVGAVSCSVTHHLEGMQGGPHAKCPFPTNEIRAVNNFVIASREGLMRLGFDRREAMANGSFWLGTFDSHFPNGHTDFPAHFHIIPCCRDGKQVHHFYVRGEDGRITSDCYQDMSTVLDVWDRVTTYKPGDTFPIFDGDGRTVLRVTMLKDGTGLELTQPETKRAVRLAAPRPCDEVNVLEKEGAAWKTVATIAANDDPIAGKLQTPEGEVRYDPITGARIP